jgi:hypothetical protein
MLSSNTIFSQVVYVNYFDALYPFVNTNPAPSYPPIDINGDGTGDFKILFNTTSCNSSNQQRINFTIADQGSANRVNGLGNSILGLDCTNDTLNATDSWNQFSLLTYVFPNTFCSLSLGIGTHKQGFKLVLTNPANGALGAKYGYIDYTIASDFSIIIHGWYYQNTFNAPIWANSQLTFPSDGNCLQIDTLTVYDTITTNINIYDTITTNINVYDTVLVSVTDTLIINTSLGLPAPNNSNTISVYPNPANDHITIDNGNFALMPNYSIVIENSLGQIVFSSLINQQQFYLDIMGWAGNGMYYLKLLNPQNSIVTTRKIVLE